MEKRHAQYSLKIPSLSISPTPLEGSSSRDSGLASKSNSMENLRIEKETQINQIREDIHKENIRDFREHINMYIDMFREDISCFLEEAVNSQTYGTCIVEVLFCEHVKNVDIGYFTTKVKTLHKMFLLACRLHCFGILEQLKSTQLPTDIILQGLKATADEYENSMTIEFIKVFDEALAISSKCDRCIIMCEMLSYCCEQNHLHCLQIFPFEHIPLKQITAEIRRAYETDKIDILDVLLGITSGYKGSCKTNQLQTRLQDLRTKYDHLQLKYQSQPWKIPFDIIICQKLSYMSTCRLIIHDVEKKLSKLSHGESSKDIPYDNVIPCNNCVQASQSKIDFQRFFKVWTLSTQCQNVTETELEDAVNEGNYMFVAVVVSKRQSLLHHCVNYTLCQLYNVLGTKEKMQLMIKVLSHIVLHKFHRSMKSNFHYLRVFLAYEKTLNAKIVAIYRGVHSSFSLCRSFLGFIIHWKSLLMNRDPNEKSDLPKKEVMLTILPSVAKRLFKDHCNLNIISTSAFKIGQNGARECKCIVLYCWAKGYIPLGEQDFPDKINGIPTDIREGFAFFGGRSELQIGKPIGTLRNGLIPKIGTTGGFLEKNGRSFILTCAHVLFTGQELQHCAGTGRCFHPYPVLCPYTKEKYGVTSAFIFQTDDQTQTSVDAALIEIDEDVTIKSNIPETNEAKLRKAGFIGHSPPSFHNGEVLDIRTSRLYGNHVIKYGSQTGLTRGSLCLDGMQVKLEHIPLTLQEPCHQTIGETFSEQIHTVTDTEITDHSEFIQYPWHPKQFTMYNQLEIDSHAQFRPFFEIGDSGASVFLNKDGSLKCIGMAIGCTSYGTCIMTPIMDILDQFEAVIDPLKECDKLHFKSFVNVPYKMEASSFSFQSHESVESGAVFSRSTSYTSDRDTISRQVPTQASDVVSLISQLSRQFGDFEKKIDKLDKKTENIDKKMEETIEKLHSLEQNMSFSEQP